MNRVEILHASFSEENCDWALIKNWLTEEASYAFLKGEASGFDAFTDEEVQEFKRLMAHPAFMKNEKYPYQLFVFFESEWQLLSDNYKRWLLGWIENHFDVVSDPVAWYAMAELLGEFYASRKSLFVLMRLSHSPNEPARSLIPIGLTKYIESSSEMQSEAMQQLERMQSDPSPRVREEVKQCLARAKRRKLG